MIILLLSIYFNNILVSGSTSSDQVDQTPADIYTKGENVKVYCSHSIQSYDEILWYKQSEKQLQYLGYMNIDKGYPETGVNVTMEGNANKGKNCTLTIKDLKVAVYL
ncbi:unnamed protein product [Oreochromis niloticus]|nr:unnamed protein product [Mustela putorius furo]